MAKYTFMERCVEVVDLYRGDGTQKIFLNMKSKNGRDELVSLLQYMKYTTLDNPDVTVKNQRIAWLDEIVFEVKRSEECEEVRMNIYGIGLKNGEERLNRLYLILIDNKRYEDLEKAARDKEYREQLYEEYQL